MRIYEITLEVFSKQRKTKIKNKMKIEKKKHIWSLYRSLPVRWDGEEEIVTEQIIAGEVKWWRGGSRCVDLVRNYGEEEVVG
jgi:hypothetical protein